jgi:hypothetical protein
LKKQSRADKDMCDPTVWGMMRAKNSVLYTTECCEMLHIALERRGNFRTTYATENGQEVWNFEYQVHKKE